MKKSAPESGWQPEDNPKLLTICELIDAGQYDQAADRIHQVQKTNQNDQENFPPKILDAACQICLACKQIRTERDHHQRAYEEANQREQTLQEQLLTIIKPIIQDDLTKYEEKDKTQHTDIKSTIETPNHEEPSSIWQHIQNILGLKNFQPPSSKELPLELEDEALHQVSTVDPLEVKDAGLPDDFDRNLEDQSHPSLMVYCLGQFQVYQNDQLLKEWPSSKGKSIFKYMITNRRQPVPKEVLMELFWPEAQPNSARNNLNVSIYGLRQALRNINPNYSHILFQEESYLLNPDMIVWNDVEEFTKRFKAGVQNEKRGETSLAMQDYQVAETLYLGEFLAEDRYEDWLIPQRQTLQDNYLELLDRLSHYHFNQGDFTACVAVSNRILSVDPCR